jgi:flagellar biosynthetic protein FlhB
MAEESSGQEKTEDPTDRRLADGRKKGDVAKSMEVPSAAVLLAGLLTIYSLHDHMFSSLKNLTSHYLSNAHNIEIIPENITYLVLQCLSYMAQVLGPLLAVVFITALVANYAQIGVIFTTEKIKPELKKIDPIQGIAKKFSMQTLNELMKSLFKVAAIGYIAYREVNKALPQFMPLMDQEPMQILIFRASTAFWIFFKCALFIALLAVVDYAFQRWQFMKKMKMTKQELKEEAKQSDGDPHVKGRIRAIQMEMARKRMMDEVPSADVVITNPTRLAIALRYDNESMNAPIVVAKGAGLVAQRIREVATENKVPIVEDKPLARALFQAATVDQPIPDNLYQAVAEVLAYVYGMRKRAA